MNLSSGTDPTTIHALVINEKKTLESATRYCLYKHNNFMPRRFWEIGSFINVQRVTHKNSMFSVFYFEESIY